MIAYNEIIKNICIQQITPTLYRHTSEEQKLQLTFASKHTLVLYNTYKNAFLICIVYRMYSVILVADAYAKM